MKEFIKALKSDDQYFEIITENAEHIPTSTSAQMLGPNPNAVSANHCQGGKSAKIFKIVIIDIVEGGGEGEGEGIRKKSRKRRKIRKTNKNKQKRRGTNYKKKTMKTMKTRKTTKK